MSDEQEEQRRNSLSIVNIRILPAKLVKGLVGIALLLSIFSLFAQALQHFSILKIPPKIVLFLNVDAERNFPTLYSAGLLLLCSILLYVISAATRAKRQKLYWLGLSLIFAFLSADELLELHENINGLLRSRVQIGEAIFSTGFWDGFSLLLFMTVSLAYFKFFLSLPPSVKRLFFIAAIVFVVGGAGIEFIGVNFLSHIYQQSSFLKEVISTAEEFLEILGTCLFIRSLLEYMQLEGGVVRLEIL
jgi:hypothetical protein